MSARDRRTGSGGRSWLAEEQLDERKRDEWDELDCDVAGDGRWFEMRDETRGNANAEQGRQQCGDNEHAKNDRTEVHGWWWRRDASSAAARHGRRAPPRLSQSGITPRAFRFSRG